MNREPLKRSVSLQPLSHEHHHALVLCRRLRTGIAMHVDELRMKRYADWFYEEHLLPHFYTEEQLIFPILGKTHEGVGKALFEHRRIKRLFAKEKNVIKSLSLIEEELEKHIRFEERLLFAEIERTATPAQLAEIKRLHQHPQFVDNTSDEFWKCP